MCFLLPSYQTRVHKINYNLIGHYLSSFNNCKVRKIVAYTLIFWEKTRLGEVLQVFHGHTARFSTDLPHSGALGPKQGVNPNAI